MDMLIDSIMAVGESASNKKGHRTSKQYNTAVIADALTELVKDGRERNETFREMLSVLKGLKQERDVVGWAAEGASPAAPGSDRESLLLEMLDTINAMAGANNATAKGVDAFNNTGAPPTHDTVIGDTEAQRVQHLAEERKAIEQMLNRDGDRAVAVASPQRRKFNHIAKNIRAVQAAIPRAAAQYAAHSASGGSASVRAPVVIEPAARDPVDIEGILAAARGRHN